MSAKEMFEELGYNKVVSNDFLIEYTNYEITKKVVFYKILKEVLSYEATLTIPLLKAINKQVEELGWNK